ncbi:hypothetical protein H8S95_12550 [Pontibacter sp. KCTC 32443]|uniref:DUF7683 domain-containing protein n=1 Tax=Pontibacter TaxID=323449 RepID=UPI00164D3579|nr:MULTISPECIES: hypothetical protein [Pontibacter]MBC5774898.1 hypothetical protein [Pontibacter sp. KCTC 32443]
MSRIKERIHQIIESSKGVSPSELQMAIGEAESSLIEKSIEKLIEEGLVVYIWDKYYSTGRQIAVYSKEDEKLVKLLELPDLAVEEIDKILLPHLSDPLFYECYQLNSENSIHFTDKYRIDFDFDKYDYYLEAYFDNSAKEKKNNS